MPETDEIRARAKDLWPDCWVQYGHEIDSGAWEGKAYGARFELVKLGGHVFEGQSDFYQLQLSLRGKLPGQQRLKQEFIEALGKPEFEIPSKKFSHPQKLAWRYPL